MQRNSKIIQNVEKNQSIQTDPQITQLVIYIRNLTSKNVIYISYIKLFILVT